MFVIMYIYSNIFFLIKKKVQINWSIHFSVTMVTCLSLRYPPTHSTKSSLSSALPERHTRPTPTNALPLLTAEQFLLLPELRYVYNLDKVMHLRFGCRLFNFLTENISLMQHFLF